MNKNELKILFVLPQVYPFVVGGAEIFHYHLLKQLSKIHKVGYIGCDDVNDIDIKYYKLSKIRPWKLVIPIQVIAYLIVLRNQYDIIHLNYSQGSSIHWFFYPIIKKIYSFKYGLTIHDPSLDEWKQKKIFKWVFNKANFIVAVSERLKDGYEVRCGREIIYLPPLIPLNKSSEQKSQLLLKQGFEYNSKIFLFAGSLKDTKRPLIIIDAINIIEKEWLNKNKIHFLFAGDGDLKKKMNDKIKEYNIEKYVKIIGRIPQEELSNYYQLSSYYIIPSVYEGKSMSLIEAMFNGLPIIASDSPGINDIIFDNINGLLFQLDDYKELAAKIVKIVSDNDLAIRIANKSYEDYLTHFNFKKMLDKYIKLYSL